MTLKFYRDYNTFESIASNFGIDKASAFRWINKIENQVDVTECEIQRLKNKELQVKYYSGKKKKHNFINVQY